MWNPFFIPMHIVRQAIAYCLILISSIGMASSLETNTRTISLHEAITKTITNNPDLRVFDYRLKAQKGKEQQAELAPSPELSIELQDVLGTDNYKGVDSAQTTLGVSWVIERGVRQHYIDSARAGSSLFFVEANIKQLDAAAETARRYLVSLAFQARMVNADKTIQIAKETINTVQNRVKAGKTPEAELSRAKAELARRKLEREDIGHELITANRRLAAQWGETKPDFGKVEGDIVKLPIVETYAILKSRLQKNPEFARLISKQRLKKSELQLAHALNKPNWRVKAGVRHFGSSSDAAFVAGISFPFGKRTKNPGRIAEASANLERIGKEENAARIRIETALYVMYEKLQHSLHVINTVRDEIIPPLEQALTETRRAYNLGRYRYQELRSVQVELLDAHDALIEASIDAHRNIIEIERLTGVRIAQPSKKL